MSVGPSLLSNEGVWKWYRKIVINGKEVLQYSDDEIMWSYSPDKDTAISPSYYTEGGIEVIDFIEAWDLNFRLANVIKYCVRAGKKDPKKHIEDLQKARYYLDREIKRCSK